MHSLKNDETMRTILNNTKVIKSKRQLPNLKRLLVKSEFKEINILPSVSKCNEPRCGICNYIIEGFSLKLNNKVFHVKENMNCNVKNVMCVLICNGCRENYIGQTGDKLRNRRTTRQLPHSSHLEQCSLINTKFSIFPFYKFHNNDVSARLSKEKNFIKIFNPKLNKD